MRTRRRVAALAMVLIVTSLATATTSADAATVALTIEAPARVDPGTVHAVTVTIDATFDAVACAASTELPVDLRIDASRAHEDVLISGLPTTVNLTIPVGAYTAANPHTASAEVSGLLLVARYAKGATTSTFIVTATLGAAPATCAAAPDAFIGAAEAEVQVHVNAVPESDPRFHPAHEAHGGGAFDKYLAAGERFSFTFDTPGRFAYHDHLNPSVKGMVRVLRVADGEADPIIHITKRGFTPSDLAVKAGTTVTWVNDDDVTRAVSSDEAHDADDVVEPEDEQARLAAARAAQGPNNDAGDAAETPPLSIGLSVIILTTAAVLRRKRR